MNWVLTSRGLTLYSDSSDYQMAVKWGELPVPAHIALAITRNRKPNVTYERHEADGSTTGRAVTYYL